MYTTDIDAGRRRVVTTWGTIATDKSLMTYQTSVWSDPQVHGFDELIDFRALDEIAVTPEGLEAVAHVAARMDLEIGQSRFAIVADDNLSFGLSRMYEAFRDMNEKTSRCLRIFRRLEDALAWLDGRTGA
jgi:hypothetical protein